MRILIAILFLLNVLVLQGLEPRFELVRENSYTAIVTPVVNTKTSIKSKTNRILSKIKTLNALTSQISEVRQKIYHRERFFIKSRFSGRTRPLLKSTNIKLSYNHVVVPVSINRTGFKRHSFIKNSSPFVSVVYNRKSIFSDAPAFRGTYRSGMVESFNDMGVSIGAGVRVPITTKFQVDIGVRDELGLLNLDGFVLKNNSFSQNNSLGFTLGLKYTI